MNFKKEYKSVECNHIACTFYGKCSKCATEIVKTRDDNNIDLFFIGQGAGAEEDKNGRPFQGPAGRLLRSKLKPYLENKNLNIILDNTIRSRPLDQDGKNRAPTEKELTFCKDFVWQRIIEFKPKIVIPLGASATQTMIPEFKNSSISSVRGNTATCNGFTFLPTFHPAAILHAGEMERKLAIEATMIKDFEEAIKLTKESPDLL